MVVEWQDLDPVYECEWVRFVANVEGWNELVKLARRAGLPIESSGDLRDRGAEKCSDPEAKQVAKENPGRILWLSESPDDAGWKPV